MDHAFDHCLEKIAISAGTTLRFLQGRMAQGARVAPGILGRAEQAAAAGMTTTPSAMRQVALGAGDAARMQGRAAALAPVKSGLQARIGAADAMGNASFSQTPLRMHDALGNTHAYSQGHINTIAGSSSRVLDPKGVMGASARPIAPSAATVPGRRPAATTVPGRVNPTAATVPGRLAPMAPRAM